MFDLENLNPGVTFTHENKWSVTLRMITAEVFTDLQKRAVKRKREFKDGQIYEYDDIDQDLHNEITWDYCIVDWDIKDQHKKPIECTKENKIRLMGNSAEFSLFVSQCLGEMTDQLQQKRETLEKN